MPPDDSVSEYILKREVSDFPVPGKGFRIQPAFIAEHHDGVAVVADVFLMKFPDVSESHSGNFAERVLPYVVIQPKFPGFLITEQDVRAGDAFRPDLFQHGGLCLFKADF